MNAKRINEIMMDCMFKNHEIVDGKPVGEMVEVEGLTKRFGFHPGRLESHKAELKAMVDDLDPTFYNGGWSFLKLPLDKNGEQWGEQYSAQEFYALCAGLGMARFQVPRDMWSMFPGGVPYIEFSKEGFDGEKTRPTTNTSL